MQLSQFTMSTPLPFPLPLQQLFLLMAIAQNLQHYPLANHRPMNPTTRRQRDVAMCVDWMLGDMVCARAEEVDELNAGD